MKSLATILSVIFFSAQGALVLADDGAAVKQFGGMENGGVDTSIRNLSDVLTQARAVPHFENGQPAGYTVIQNGVEAQAAATPIQGAAGQTEYYAARQLMLNDGDTTLSALQD